MCDLTEELVQQEFEGFKVVAEEIATGNNFSLAMGFCYNDYPDRIPIVLNQKVLTTYFLRNILNSTDSHGPFNINMVGRTAVFARQPAAHKLAQEISINQDLADRFEVKVKRATVSHNLMKGFYGWDIVIAGNKIQIFEEVTE